MDRPWSRPVKLRVTPDAERGLAAIGAWIRAARRDVGMTQQHLENVSGVDQTVISRLENGRLLSIRFVRLAAIVGALRDPRVKITRHSEVPRSTAASLPTPDDCRPRMIADPG